MFLVVFRNRKRADLDAAAYAADAARMAALASAQPGYLAFKSYTAEDGEVVAISEWADEASARAWGRHAEHAPVQGKGRAGYYQDYTLFACDNPRIHRFERPAP
ncbi:antibiotic biosynthesis monooxygenase family protein [Novosphingobium album (ex Liu et al. 2023)]|uniref:Antibiotic biosynthesis monooxygenase n=1 Tax=Novosphingobium album (ex Liu et al. 2023) TaxID=3031130 RepID=A0ABT5WVP9_9SPHN|nr:antibiotic biosynthesis monooxygenase [Novosphingobium album (ex Liu et al. 2023)]MDE8653979.1 antibiotic biosynthesis monooxygenase [Novosphingobium album (ex Liu et al. 2023)]